MIRRCTNIAKTVITFCLWTTLIPPFLIACTLLALLPARWRYDNRLYFFLTSSMSWLIIKSAFLRITIHGRKNLPTYPNTPAIVIMNHASAFDIPMIEVLVGSYPHVWISKSGYKNVPLVGFLLKRMHVMVDKTSTSSARRALIGMHDLIKDQNRHALIFPEGTRHDDGQVHKFFSGFAVLAQKLQRPVIPIVATNMHLVFPKKSLIIDSSSTHVTINIGKPIYCPADADLPEFVRSVEEHFKETLTTTGV